MRNMHVQYATRSSFGQSQPLERDVKKIIIGSHLPSAPSPRGQRAEIPTDWRRSRRDTGKWMHPHPSVWNHALRPGLQLRRPD